MLINIIQDFDTVDIIAGIWFTISGIIGVIITFKLNIEEFKDTKPKINWLSWIIGPIIGFFVGTFLGACIFLFVFTVGAMLNWLIQGMPL